MIESPEKTSQGISEFSLTDDPIEELDRYTKTIDDLIEDAEIEAEMEAAKHIRSKNTRVFTISVIGVALLGFLYYQVQNREPSAPAVDQEMASLASLAEEQLAVPISDEVVKDTQAAEALLLNENPGEAKPAEVAVEPAKASPKPEIPAVQPLPPAQKPVEKAASAPAKQKSASTVNKPKAAIAKSAPKSPPKASPANTPAQSQANGKFYIQLGAFSVKGNADKFVKHLTGKGFNPDVQVKQINAKRQIHFVRIGGFDKREKAVDVQEKLIQLGFKNSFIR